MQIKIVRVDMYGYCGRDYHPETSDIGRTVTVLGMEAFIIEPWGALRSSDAPEHIDEANIVCIWDVITRGGKRLELTGDEIEFIHKN